MPHLVGKNRILKYPAPDTDGQIFIYIADLSANDWVYPKNVGPIGETVSKQLAVLFTLQPLSTNSPCGNLLTFLATKAILDKLDAIFLIFYMEWQALLGSRGKKLFQTAPNTSKRLEIGVRRPHLVQGLEFFFTTALCAAPNPLLLTVVRSLGVVRANFCLWSSSAWHYII